MKKNSLFSFGANLWGKIQSKNCRLEFFSSCSVIWWFKCTSFKDHKPYFLDDRFPPMFNLYQFNSRQDKFQSSNFQSTLIFVHSSQHIFTHYVWQGEYKQIIWFETLFVFLGILGLNIICHWNWIGNLCLCMNMGHSNKIN